MSQCVSDPVCLCDNDSLMSAAVSTLKRQASEPSLRARVCVAWKCDFVQSKVSVCLVFMLSVLIIG